MSAKAKSSATSTAIMTAIESVDDEEKHSSVEGVDEEHTSEENQVRTSHDDSVGGVEETETPKILKKYAPQDCFSLLQNSSRSTFWFGLLIPLLQIGIYAVFLIYAGAASQRTLFNEIMGFPTDLHTHNYRTYTVDDGTDIKLAEESFWFKGKTPVAVDAAKALAMISYVLIPEAGIADLIKAIHQRPSGCICVCKGHRLVSIFRFFHSWLAIYTVAVLISTADESVDVFLNFAAMNFASDIDENAFKLAHEGLFGEKLEKEAEIIAKGETVNDEEAELEKQKKKKSHWIGMALVGTFFFLVFVIETLEVFNITAPLMIGHASHALFLQYGFAADEDWRWDDDNHD